LPRIMGVHIVHLVYPASTKGKMSAIMLLFKTKGRICLKRVIGKPYLSSPMIGADQTSCNLVMIPAAHPVIAKPKFP
jgi:hypothetical protein